MIYELRGERGVSEKNLNNVKATGLKEGETEGYTE